MKILRFLPLVCVLLGIPPEAGAHSGNVVEGIFGHVVATPDPALRADGGRRVFLVFADDGHNVPVDISAATLPPGGVKALMNRRVRITASPGVAAQSFLAGQKVVALTVELLEPSVNASSMQADVFPVAGNRRYISLLCKWPDSLNGEPSPPAYFQAQLGDTYPGFNHYFQEMSYGAANIDGSNALPVWVTMPKPRSFYYGAGQPNDGSYLFAMAQGCVSAADSLVDFNNYDGINVMFNDRVDSCCAWGGSGQLRLEGVTRPVSLTWMPFTTGGTFGWRQHGVLAHELSHSFGSPHSNGPGGYQYNNMWDVVSDPGGTCAVTSPPYGCIGQHAVGDNKLAMGFIAPARIATHPSSGAAATYAVERVARPQFAPGSHQLLKVNSVSAHRYYTVESRQRVGYDQNVPGDGVIIHEVVDNRPVVSSNNPGDPARLLRPDGLTTPALGSTLGGLPARFSAGTYYANPSDKVYIRVKSYDAETGTATIVVNDNFLQFASRAPSILEKTRTVVLSVTRTGYVDSSADVAWTAVNGTAIAGQDYGTAGVPTPPSGTLHWNAGDSTAKQVVIQILDDAMVEGSETFTVQLGNPVGDNLSIDTNATATVTILDDELGFSFASAAYGVTEGTPSVTLSVQRVGSLTNAATVRWTTVNGSAIAGQDYGTPNNAAQRSGNLSWAAGEGANKSIVIPILDDVIGGEGDETFTATLTSLTPEYGIGPNGVATVTIQDNDIAPQTQVRFTKPKYVVSESAGVVAVVVDRVVLSTCVLASSVKYATVPGTAVAAADYITTSGTLSWEAGDCSPRQLNVNIVNSGSIEPAETFKVVLSTPTPETRLGDPAEATVVILDEDEVFPPKGAIPDGFGVPAEATRGWHVSSDAGAYAGLYSLKTDQVEDGDSAGLEMTGTFAAGPVSFRVKVSSEADFDLLRFYIDGVLKGAWSGTAITAWQLSPTYPLVAGPHTLKWLYSKDSSASLGLDAAYLDALVTPAFTPAP